MLYKTRKHWSILFRIYFMISKMRGQELGLGSFFILSGFFGGVISQFSPALSPAQFVFGGGYEQGGFGPGPEFPPFPQQQGPVYGPQPQFSSGGGPGPGFGPQGQGGMGPLDGQFSQFGPPGQFGPQGQFGPGGQFGPQGTFGPGGAQLGQGFGPAQINDFISNIFKNFANGGGIPPSGGSPFNFPDLSNITRFIPKGGFFFDTSPFSRRAVADLRGILSRIQDRDAFVQASVELRRDPNLNPHIWLRSFMAALLARPDVNTFEVPSLVEVIPSLVLTDQVLGAARAQVQVPQGQRSCVVLDGSAGEDNGIENRLWYFREDVMVNSHHWFWHLNYPVFTQAHADRRGELFLHFHHSLLARYQAERLANSLSRVTPLDLQQGALIPEGYSSHLTDSNSGIPWTSRPPNTPQPDFVGIFYNLSLPACIEYNRRILQAIDAGNVMLPGNRALGLNPTDGADILGDIIEASVFSVNPALYGGQFGLHNSGHVVIANSVDPLGRRQIPPGVMSETATAVRDVVFYRWHAMIDGLYGRFKSRLGPYQPIGGDLQLSWPGIAIESIQVTTSRANEPNRLRTFWSSKTVDISNGLAFQGTPTGGQLLVCVRHLDNEEFRFQLSIRNGLNGPARATVRIFMAPRFNERGERLSMSEQYSLFFVMDTFRVDLQPGLNPISRSSLDSSLTISWPQSLTELNRMSPTNNQSMFCGCGWPQHMILPRGTVEGMAFDLFVIVTNDPQSAIPVIGAPGQSQQCREAYLYCGSRGRPYPDPRPMGYPFDRPPFVGQSGQGPVANLDEYIRGGQNMGAIQVTILHQPPTQ